MKNEKLTALLAAPRRSRFGYGVDYDDYDRYSVGSYGGRPNRRDCYEYGLNLLNNNVQSLQANRSLNGPTREEILAVGALDEINKVIGEHQYLKSDENRQRAENHRLRDMIARFAEAPTTVTIMWSQEAEDWCAEQKGKYTIVKNGTDASFVFESLDAAALFKLRWHE